MSNTIQQQIAETNTKIAETKPLYEAVKRQSQTGIINGMSTDFGNYMRKKGFAVTQVGATTTAVYNGLRFTFTQDPITMKALYVSGTLFGNNVSCVLFAQGTHDYPKDFRPDLKLSQDERDLNLAEHNLDYYNEMANGAVNITYRYFGNNRTAKKGYESDVFLAILERIL